jgi:hypothetical protein
MLPARPAAIGTITKPITPSEIEQYRQRSANASLAPSATNAAIKARIASAPDGVALQHSAIAS